MAYNVFKPSYQSGLVINATTTASEHTVNVQNKHNAVITNLGDNFAYIVFYKNSNGAVVANDTCFIIPPKAQISLDIADNDDRVSVLAVDAATDLHVIFGDGA
jgi:Uma2 family endonuclease